MQYLLNHNVDNKMRHFDANLIHEIWGVLQKEKVERIIDKTRPIQTLECVSPHENSRRIAWQMFAYIEDEDTGIVDELFREILSCVWRRTNEEWVDCRKCRILIFGMWAGPCVFSWCDLWSFGLWLNVYYKRDNETWKHKKKCKKW